MDLDTLVTQLTDAKVQLSQKVTEMTTLKTELDVVKAQLAELVKKTPDEAQAKLTKVEPELEAAVTFLRDQATKALVATGQDISKVKDLTIAELSKSIIDAQAKLATLFPAGGKAAGIVTDGDKKTVDPSLSAFQTRKAEGVDSHGDRQSFSAGDVP